MFRRKREEDLSVEVLAQDLESIRERKEYLSLSIRALGCYLKDFSFDLADIDSEGYKRHIDEMVKSLLSDESNKSVERKFERDHKQIAAFITKERKYLEDREAEFKNLIELLSKGLVDVIGENREFGNKVSQGSFRLEQISNIDDIRRVKEALKVEIAQMRDVIREKQSRDEKLVNRLESEVDILRTDLERVHKVAITDPLTGAYNRYSFDSYIHNCVERNVIAWKPFCLLLCDLDNFKTINDTHGHRVGDAVLAVFVHECRSVLRAEDYIARYGGDEFVIVLHGANLRNAVNKANSICHLFNSKQHVFNGGEISAQVRIAVSIGVAEAHRRDTMEGLIERADSALYKAKESGRNRSASERDVNKAAA